MSARSIELVKHPLPVRKLEVGRITEPAPRYRLVTLTGDDLADFETLSPTDHVGIIPPAASGALLLPDVDEGRMRRPAERPSMREYTVRRFDAAADELDVRVLMHGSGPVSDWAASAEAGDKVGVIGPRVSEVMPDGYPNYLLAGALTAIPAIARWLTALPDGAMAQIVVPARDEDDVIEFHCAQPISVLWLTAGGKPEADQLPLALSALELYSPDTWAWAAGEALAMRQVWHVLLDKPGLSKETVMVTGYWRRYRTDFDYEAPLDAD